MYCFADRASYLHTHSYCLLCLLMLASESIFLSGPLSGYGHFKGQILNSKELNELFIGLKENDLHHYSHLLTGIVIISVAQVSLYILHASHK